jgi:hypothetical protein
MLLPTNGNHAEITEGDLELDTDEDDQVERKERPSVLEGVPLAVQEAWVCEDLCFVLKVRVTSAGTARYQADSSLLRLRRAFRVKSSAIIRIMIRSTRLAGSEV